MIERDEHNPLTRLNLPEAVETQVLKLLGNIAQSRSAADCARGGPRRRFRPWARVDQGVERSEH